VCLEFADKILIFAVLKQRLLQRRETQASFCFYNYNYVAAQRQLAIAAYCYTQCSVIGRSVCFCFIIFVVLLRKTSKIVSGEYWANVPYFPEIVQLTAKILRFNGFQIVAVRHLIFLKFEILTGLIWPISVIVPNFVAIGQTVVQLS